MSALNRPIKTRDVFGHRVYVRLDRALGDLDGAQREAVKELLADADPCYFAGGPVADAVVDALCGKREARK